MGHRCCGKQKVKRGLWSPEEDEKLLSFITSHGHSSWSAVPKHAGLERCGKSCRLRWINYLRPDLKRGSFTEEEERTIIEVHRILGNRWAQIAKHLPGRTDNEVKNFWNSCIKRKLLAHGFDPNTHNLLPAASKPSPASRMVKKHKQARHHHRHHDDGHDHQSSPTEVFTVDTVRPHKKGDTHPPLGPSTIGTSSFAVSHSTSSVAHGFGMTDQPSMHAWDDHLQLQHTNTNTAAGIMEESELQMLSTLQMPAAQSFDHLPPFMGNNAAGSDFDFGFGDYDAIIQSGIYGDALTSMDHLAWDIAN